MSNEEETAGATKLDWSDDDDFFGDDDDVDGTMDSGDGKWGDSFDEDADASRVDRSEAMEESGAQFEPDPDFEPETKEPEEVSDDGGASEDPVESQSDRADNDDDEHKHETGETSGVNSHVKEENVPSSTSPRVVSSGNKPPLLPTDDNNNNADRVPITPIFLPGLSGFGLMGSSGKGVDSTPIPMSLSGTPGTPFVEIADEDEKFEEIVRQRNRVRKEREDYHIAHIKVQMGRLEDALAAETKRRVDATTALDELARTQVHEMEDRVKEQLREENEKLQSRLGVLEERVRRLEENWAIDANRQIEIVNSKASELGKAISRIHDDQDMERKSRLKREGILLRQVEEHAKETEDRWNAERKDRIERLKELEDSILRNEARLALEQRRYEDRLDKELTLLKEELSVEIDERQAQDEQIVAALNRYTQQLQHSLSILSSD